MYGLYDYWAGFLFIFSVDTFLQRESLVKGQPAHFVVFSKMLKIIRFGTPHSNVMQQTDTLAKYHFRIDCFVLRGYFR